MTDNYEIGDRVWSNYTYSWLTVVTKPDSAGWFDCEDDDGVLHYLNAERISRVRR